MLDYLQSGDDVSNEVLLLLDARKVVPAVVTSQPKVYRNRNRNRKLEISKAPLESQAQGTSLFTSAALR